MNKVIRIICILCIFNHTEILAQQPKKEKMMVSYSDEQFKTEDEWYDAYIYPRPKVKDSDLVQIIKAKSQLDFSTIKTFYTHEIKASVIIDTTGNLKKITINSFQFPEKMRLCANIIKATDSLWNPAIKNKKKEEMEIHFPIKFINYFENGKIYSKVLIFHNFPEIFNDSTDVHAALLKLNFNDKNYLVNDELYTDKKVSNYGTTSLGFEIDTFGKISAIEILNSAGADLDSEAVTFINLTSGKWIPAEKQGIKRESYKVFNVYFTGILNNKNENLESLLVLAKDSNEKVPFKHFNSKIMNDLGKILESESLKNVLVDSKLDTSSIRISLTSDYKYAEEFMSQRKHSTALKLYNKLCQFGLRDPELFYNRALCHFQLNQNEQGCEDLGMAQSLADLYGYPVYMDAEQIKKFRKQNCGIGEE